MDPTDLLRILSPRRPALLALRPKLVDEASRLRGGRQPAGQLLQQLKGRPGVRPGALTEVFGHIDPGAKLTPTELAASARSPKLYAQSGARRLDLDNDDMAQELIYDLMYSAPELERRRLQLLPRAVLARASRRLEAEAESRGEEIARSYREIVDRASNLERMIADGHAPSLDALRDLEDDVFTLERVPVSYGSWFQDRHRDLVGGELYEPAVALFRRSHGMTERGDVEWSPLWQQYQRQHVLKSLASSGRYPGSAYFETVLRGTPSTYPFLQVASKAERSPADWHFSNPAQLGHARGTVLPSPNRGLFVEELQSDPLETLGETGALRDVYGKLGRMLIDRAAAADLPAVFFPNGKRVASVRPPQHAAFYRQLYDRDLARQLYEPLAAKGLVPEYQGDDHGWWRIPLSPEVREALRGGQSGLLDYRRGGLVGLRRPRAQG